VNEALQTVLDALPYMLQGALVTCALVLASLALGLALGVPLAVGQVYGPRWLNRLIRLYVWFFRGVPIVVLMILFYFGLFTLLEINLSAFSAAAMVLGLTSAAYQSQIFRGSIQSLPGGQLKAARALGMSDTIAIWNIIIPQALRLSIPGWSNEFSIILKDSAVAFVLGTTELMARTHFVSSRTFQHLPLFLAAGAIYYFLTYAGVRGLRSLERRVRIKGYSHGS